MQLNIHVEKLTQFNKNQHQFYEKELVNSIFMPYQELCRMWTKINNSDKERKELTSTDFWPVRNARGTLHKNNTKKEMRIRRKATGENIRKVHEE